MKKILFVFLSLLVAVKSEAQQDPQYNLYQFNQMVINPAYAGARDGLAAIAATRKQWVGFNGAPQTTCLSVHSPIAKKNIGLGLTAVSDIMGPRNVFSIYGNFAYILKLNSQLKLSFGLNAGFNRYQFNFSEITFKQGEVPAQLLTTQNKGVLDLTSGIFLKSPDFFIGISASHLNSPNVYNYEPVVPGTGNYIYKIKRHLYLSVGKSFIINKNLTFAPTVLVKVVNNVYGADLNLNFFIQRKLWLGAFYRNGYGPGGLVQYYITPKLRVAYSYDSGIMDARRLGGSHEVMIGFDFSNNTNNPKTKMVNPRFL
ncbi:MAG: type IX secretion system membrane protein PorP/SprF [Bacteroidia bacterium]|nr:type IX secretion system membrane protein PorP/SprF [Bacteroidia bacterium]